MTLKMTITHAKRTRKQYLDIHIKLATARRKYEHIEAWPKTAKDVYREANAPKVRNRMSKNH